MVDLFILFFAAYDYRDFALNIPPQNYNQYWKVKWFISVLPAVCLSICLSE